MLMGQAIIAQMLRYNCAIAIAFVEWLQRLFDLPKTVK
jgi:hypothetical protein